MTDTDLKYCPFCGKDASLYHDRISKTFESFKIYCRECGSESGSYTHKHQAIEAWNQRNERT